MDRLFILFKEKLESLDFNTTEISQKEIKLKKCLEQKNINDDKLILIPEKDIHNVLNIVFPSKQDKFKIECVKGTKKGTYQYKIYGIDKDDKKIHSKLKEEFNCFFIKSGNYWSCFLDNPDFDMNGFLSGISSKQTKSKQTKSEKSPREMSNYHIERVEGKKKGTYQYKIHGVSSKDKDIHAKLKKYGCIFIKSKKGVYWSCFSPDPDLKFNL